MANVIRLAARIQERVPWLDDEPVTVESVITCHAKAADGEDPADDGTVINMAGQLKQWWAEDGLGFSALKNVYSGFTALMDVTGQRIQPTVGPALVNPADPLVQGGQVAFNLPPQIAVGVTLVTSTEDRRTRGRIFYPAPSFDSADPGRPFGQLPVATDAFWAQTTAYLARRIRIVGGDEEDDGPWVLAVYSRLNETALAVVSFRVCESYLTQRRRALWPRTYAPFGLSGDPP